MSWRDHYPTDETVGSDSEIRCPQCGNPISLADVLTDGRLDGDNAVRLDCGHCQAVVRVTFHFSADTTAVVDALPTGACPE
jgi:hypothetical protein